MGGKTRKTGIDILGDVPWGTHFCQFYKTKEDLIDILVPYFKAGLENNEFCMWITSEPLSEKEAKEAMRETLPDFDRYLKRGQIEIFPYEEWYLKEGTFNLQRVLKGWVDKLDQALAQDYDGLRLTGNTFWREKKDWRNFTEYEKEVDNVIGKYRMMAVCSYSLDKCGASEIVDVVSNHQFALIRKEGKWATIESSQRKRAEVQARIANERLQYLLSASPAVIYTAKPSDDYAATFISENVSQIVGYKSREFVENPSFWIDHVHPDDLQKVHDTMPRLFENSHSTYEYRFRHRSGNYIWVRDEMLLVRNEKGNPIEIVGYWADITDHKQAEEELREKEEFNFALFQYNPIETIVVDLEGRVLKVNMAKRKSGDRLPNIGDVMYKDYAAKHEIDMHAELMECIRSDKAKRFSELKYGDKFLDITIAPFPGGAIIASQDITKRKRAEDAVKESEERYRGLFNWISDAVYVIDQETGRVLDVNETACKMYGYTREEWLKMKNTDVSAEPAQTRKATKDSPEIIPIRYHKKKDGTVFPLEMTLNIIDLKGRKAIIVTVRDITERKKMEEEKDKFLKTIETTKEAINIATSDAIMIYTNDAMNELFGYKKGELIGKHVSVLNAGPSRKAKKTPEHITDAIKKKGVWEGEIHNKRKDGTEFFCLAKIGALKDKNGKIINYVSSQHNITKRKLAEEEIKNSQLQLRNLSAHLQSVREEERTLIAREMHDELGQALTAMKMDLSWLDKRLPKDQRSLLEKTKSMSKLADATLQTVKKISTELRPGLLDDLGLLAAIEWQAEEFQTRTGIKCAITTDPEDIILDKDRSTAIFRIFQETLTNVARHAKATRIKVSLKEKAGKIELKVRDNGKGITEEQISNPKSFGLIGIKERAYYLDGKVVIKSLQDKGTTITIRIPLPKKGKTK